MTRIPDIVEAVTKVKEKKIVRYRNETNRASGIGYAVPELDGCLRRGVYDRTHYLEKELHDVRAQFIFDEGHSQEKQILRDMDEAGIKVINQQQPFVIKDTRPGKTNKILLSGTIEGKIVTSETGGHADELLTFEIKSMNPNIFATMNEFEDFRKKPWTLAYMAQIMAYMLGENEEIGLFILKDKSNGTLKQIPVPLDYKLGEAIMKTAEIINDHVDADTLPEKRQDVDKCWNCPHKKYCLPDIDFEVGPSVADDPALEAKIDEYFMPHPQTGSLVDMKKRADDLWKKAISPKMKVSAQQNDGKLNVILGKYRLTGKTDNRGTFRGKINLESDYTEED